ncbi:hypothetical protein HK100_005022 [Physocladia obscura]|uniref:Mitochondrial fission process protein 1 n=1 Tax=Physocladia obscura TaxID=109957 RepID=A0AAD5SSC2_9FUNG|nr:hypothetical protein HK100_005022 [Physocladia obscura]
MVFPTVELCTGVNTTNKTTETHQQQKYFLIASPASVSPTQPSGSAGADRSKKTDTNDDLTDFDSVDSPYRYLGLLGRLRTVVIAQSRLLAYTSEVGEAFRPVTNQWFVKSAYAVSWAYVIGDVGLEAYKMRNHGGSDVDVARTAIERGVFQSLASMLFPAYTVHTVVHQAARFFKAPKPSLLTRFGPSAIGLSTIPFLPLIFDKPTEHVTEYLFDAVWPLSADGKKAQAEIHGHGSFGKKEN